MVGPEAGFTPTINRFTGFAEVYDAHRPHPPTILIALLTQLARVEAPRLVVDLGCGTGLSTRLWADTAARVVGIDPTAAMRLEAQRRSTTPNVEYREGYSHATGLPNGCADIVTCAQALHWMDPQPTFAEVARLLRSGGVFAAYDYDWPPTTTDWEAEMAFEALSHRVAALETARQASPGLRRWAKAEHLTRMRESGQFRFVKEVTVHHSEVGDADRLIGMARSQGSVATLLKMGISEQEMGLADFAAVARRTLGDTKGPWLFSYRVRIGVV